MYRIDDSFADGSFNKAHQRVRRFTHRSGLSHRRRTHIAQNTRHSTDVIEDFVNLFNHRVRHVMRVPAGAVVNMDETNVDFDMPSTVTLARRGQRTVSVKGTGSSNRATVLLAVTQDGEKLPPFIIYKAKRGARVYKEVTSGDLSAKGFPPGVVMDVQANAWNDECLMLEWIKRVWRPWLQSNGMTQSVLNMDSFKAHTVRSVLTELARCGTHVSLVPEGYTSKLQVLDVGINRPFKVNVATAYRNFLVRSVHNTEKTPKPSRQEVAAWVCEAWNRITTDAILNTWRHIGIQAVGPLRPPSFRE